MGLFDKLKNVLSKTKNGLASKLASLFSGGRIKEDFYGKRIFLIFGFAYQSAVCDFG